MSKERVEREYDGFDLHRFFVDWWENHGSGIPPKKGQEISEFAEDLTRRAFDYAWNQAKPDNTAALIHKIRGVCMNGSNSEAVYKIVEECTDKLLRGLK